MGQSMKHPFPWRSHKHMVPRVNGVEGVIAVKDAIAGQPTVRLKSFLYWLSRSSHVQYWPRIWVVGENHLWDGHNRFTVLAFLGYTEVRCIRYPESPWPIQ